MGIQPSLEDITRRSNVHSKHVIDGAIDNFLKNTVLHQTLSDFAAEDEEWLQDTFRKACDNSHNNDTHATAQEFAEIIGDPRWGEYIYLFPKIRPKASRMAK